MIDKQIEELEETIRQAMYQEWKKGNSTMLETRDACGIAEHLINKGYRKAYEVAREIIGEILLNNTPDIDGFFTMHETELAELKKKYESEGEG